MKNKWLKNSNRQHLRYSMRQASGIALALVMGISVAAAGQTQSVKAAVDTQTADTGVVATTDTANQTTETTTIGKNQISIKDFASQVQKVTGKDVLKNSGIKNTAAATTNEIAAYLLNEADTVKVFHIAIQIVVIGVLPSINCGISFIQEICRYLVCSSSSGIFNAGIL